MIEILLWPLLSMCLSAGTIWMLLKTGLAGKLALDHAGIRSLHCGAIPRSGGLGMMVAIFVSTTLAVGHILPIVGLALLLSGISWLDDRHGLSVTTRLLSHFAIAIWGAALLLPNSAWLLLVCAVILLVWSINLYNFMDGANGLAGGMALIGFGFLGHGFFLTGNIIGATTCWSIALAALGFLLFNFGQAKIFMGDAGSIPLGFLAGCCSLWGWLSGSWAALFPILVFSPFLVDATLTLMLRMLRGEAIWQAHREHCYQKLIRMGWRHHHVALTYYLFMLGGGTAALLVTRLTAPWREWGGSLWIMLVVFFFHCGGETLEKTI